jgi:pimeloyl-ACP methyl ester carboxylesterase
MTTETISVDGRELEVLRHGAPDAFPLVFHCGTPNAPAEFPPLFEAVEAKGWQLVAHARPGYAGSTRHEGRSIADVAGDVAAILDHIGQREFVVLGWSGGGPHALACAALLPDRCRAAASLAGVAPTTPKGSTSSPAWGPRTSRSSVPRPTTTPSCARSWRSSPPGCATSRPSRSPTSWADSSITSTAAR